MSNITSDGNRSGQAATPVATPELEAKGISVIRALAMDGPLQANSGHQGTAMALAPLAHVLFTRIMSYDASTPDWPDRDRFVLSGGHASILLYSMLHLTGYGLELDELRDFRQWDSRTPGHPEAGHTPGVEVTTGPLGQGFGNAVGMALAERMLRTRFGSDLCDHFTYMMCGDGDLSEGVSHEAASLAGHQKLGRLIAMYDDNRITIDGPTDLALSDDAAGRFEAYGWHVIDVGDAANDLDRLTDAIEQAKAAEHAPSLIVVRTHIGYPSPNLTDHHSAHGNPFDDTETALTKEVMGLPTDERFWVPDDVLEMYRNAGSRGSTDRAAWSDRLRSSGRIDEWNETWATDLGEDHPVVSAAMKVAAEFEVGSGVATRKASQQVLTSVAEAAPHVVGGSADLTGSNGTKIDDKAHTDTSPSGRQMFFGVREHGMGSAMVGAAHHGGVLPVGGTFLVFSDYMRPSVRLAAMTHARCVFVWTHDSVGVGEDGPTHQPIEQLMSLRAIPGLRVIRPADARETAGAWAMALQHDGPTALILSRQGLPVLDQSDAAAVGRGAYRIVGSADDDLVLLATGSEVALCVAAAEQLAEQSIAASVVSMPSWDLFESQSDDYRNGLLGDRHVVSVEAGTTLGWAKYAATTIGIDRFGASAPGSLVMERLGLNVENVVETARRVVQAS